MSDIQPFGTSNSSATPDIDVIKAFGCTVIDFNVGADWASQAGSLSFNIIEDESDGDRLEIPVLGSPFLFELKTTSGEVIFQYIGIVESFKRITSSSKKYSVSLGSPMQILDASQVIMDGYVGLGGSYEGLGDFSGMGYTDFGHRNDDINITSNPGVNQWWNVSNLINVFGILENDDPLYKVPFQYDINGNPILYGDYGFSSRSNDGIPLVKLMYALHLGVNHMPILSNYQRQRTHQPENSPLTYYLYLLLFYFLKCPYS